jgi:response regulator of citrate/malate metabolism
MADKLSRQVIKALKQKRLDLQEQMLRIAEALALYDPPAPLLRRTVMEQHKAAIMELMNSSDDWTSKEAIAKKLGLKQISATKAANALVEEGKLEKNTFHGIVHYRRAVQSLRLIAGEGELPKQRSKIRRSSKVGNQPPAA